MNTTIRKVFDGYVFVFVFFLASRTISDPDFWFHIKTGEYIWKTGMVPRTDPFSFTNYGIQWIAHGWLSGFVFYVVATHWGFYALIFLFALLAALAFWITYVRSEGHAFIRGTGAVLGAFSVLPNIGVRPRVFTLLFASIYLTILTSFTRSRKGRAIWSLIPAMVLWTNLHGGFLIGLALIALTIIGVLVDTWNSRANLRESAPTLLILTTVFVASALAALINPYGIGIYASTLGTVGSPLYQEVIVDWLSPDFHQLELLPVMLLMCLSIAVLAVSPKRPRPSELFFLVATLYATFKMQRNAMIFALVAVPLFSKYCDHFLSRTVFAKYLQPPRPTANLARTRVLGLLMLLPLVPFALKLRARVYSPQSQEVMKVPVNAVEYLRQNRISGNTLTDPNIWGGYLIWALPSNPVYIDGRGHFPEGFVKEYLDITRGMIGWRDAFDRYRVQIVIAEPTSVLGRELEESSEWHKIFSDDMVNVFRRK